MKRIVTVLVVTSILMLAGGCSKDDKKFSGSEATGETVKITPESVKESMKNNNGMNR
jgi:hypothetical protein